MVPPSGKEIMNNVKPLVLMVEDNPDVLRLNKKWLQKAGYDTLSAETLSETRRILETSVQPDVVLLDILLPDGDGLNFMPELKTLCDAPVLFCSSRGEDRDVLRGLEAGGDDYIAKPYNVDILVARVNAMWRREQKRRLALATNAKTTGRVITRGPLTLDMPSARAFVNGQDANLTPKEFALLWTLMQNEGREVSAKELYETAWGLPANDDTRTVWPHISKLKKKLAVNEDGAFSIETTYGTGYRFYLSAE